MPKVVVRIKGGLGNQLFCYAAARRLALANHAQLLIDDVTGFARDRQYARRYLLDSFQIPCRKATPAERMEPFERYRRALAKLVSRRRPFYRRRYVAREGMDFDPRLLDFKVAGTVYLDGVWQSEGYFKDVEPTIRQDLRMRPPNDPRNRDTAERIRDCSAVAVHVRWFDPPGRAAQHNVSADYYRRAVEEIARRVENPHYFVFSDDPQAACSMLALSAGRATWIDHNHGDQNAWKDLWLMRQCKHFIIANSTFSWWGAWLTSYVSPMVIAPCAQIDGITMWGFRGLLPQRWIKISAPGD